MAIIPCNLEFDGYHYRWVGFSLARPANHMNISETNGKSHELYLLLSYRRD